MLTNTEKINRYELVEQAIINRIATVKKDLAYDLCCHPDKISMYELEKAVDIKMKQPIDEFFGKEDVGYYLIDKIIEEQCGLSSMPPPSVQKILEQSKTGIYENTRVIH